VADVKKNVKKGKIRRKGEKNGKVSTGGGDRMWGGAGKS